MVELVGIFNILNADVVPNLNILLIALASLLVILYFKTKVKTTIVKDAKGKDVPIEAKPKLPFTVKVLKFLSCWLGVAAILLGAYSAYIVAWSPFFNLMLVVVGIVATANDLYRFPWAAAITVGVLALIYNAGPLTGVGILYGLQIPYVFGGIGIGSFVTLYLKLDFFGKLISAGGRSLAKLQLFFAIIGVVEGILSLF